MRNDFVRQALVEMKNNREIIFLTADLGFRALEPIKKTFPDRFLNVGITEANMVGMAAGLALEGKRVIAYSIASFATMRCYEQIRDDICYHNLDVKIVATGGGFNYSVQGVTHHTIEDVAIMRVLPHMRVLCPGYSWEAQGATEAILKSYGPAYLRLGQSPGIRYEQKSWHFYLGKGFIVKKGQGVVLLVTGNLTNRALAIAESVEKNLKQNVAVVSLPTIKPLDEALIIRLARRARGIFVLEEHSIIGGLGEAVTALLVARRVIPRAVDVFAIPDRFIRAVGSRDYLLDKAGLSVKAVARAIIKQLKTG